MSNDYVKPTFTLIKGGLQENHSTSKKVFVCGSVTDTRLMGVIGMHIEWSLPENCVNTSFHQFFYFDAEEHGFDTYSSALGSGMEEDIEKIHDMENSLLGGLGAAKSSITEEEARYLLQGYVNYNIRYDIPLPEGFDEYSFLLSPVEELSRDQQHLLMYKQIPSLDSPYQIINYFLMRCFGRDFEAAKFLTKGYVRTNIFAEHKSSTLLRNTIEEATDTSSGSNTHYLSTSPEDGFETFRTLKNYMCESLIEYDGKYFLLITQITLDHLKVVKYQKVSSFRVTPLEVSMMIKKSEFVTVLDMVDGAPLFTRGSTMLVNKAMVTNYDNGQLFMIFHPHNDHVKKQIYMLNDDVLGVYYMSADSQLILSSNTVEGIRTLEADLAASPMAEMVVPVSKYEFKEPVLFDFINSGYDDFEDFVSIIAEPEK